MNYDIEVSIFLKSDVILKENKENILQIDNNIVLLSSILYFLNLWHRIYLRV